MLGLEKLPQNCATKQANISRSKLFIKIFYILVIVFAPLFGMPINSSAATITSRSVTLSTSVASAVGVNYTLTSAALPTVASIVKSANVEFCTSPNGVCVAPAGFSSAISTLASQPSGLGDATGWTVNTASANQLRVTNSTNATTPAGPVSIAWAGVQNPSTTNTTFYGIITTYSDASWTTVLDSGTVAISTSTAMQVSLTVAEILTFCTGTSITGTNCATIAGNTVSLGNGSPTTTSNGTSVMAISTNAPTGYSVTINGSTLTSGVDTITALAAQTASTVGNSQFGINLKANTTPSVGSNVSGTGSGTDTANYGTADQFRFVTGDSVASALIPTNSNTFTVSYIGNIAGITAPGIYATSLTFVATANF